MHTPSAFYSSVLVFILFFSFSLIFWPYWRSSQAQLYVLLSRLYKTNTEKMLCTNYCLTDCPVTLSFNVQQKSRLVLHGTKANQNMQAILLQALIDNSLVTKPRAVYRFTDESAFGPGNGSPMAQLLFLLFLSVVIRFSSTKAFSFHDRSSLNFVHRLATTLSTIAPCRIFKLRPN